MEFGRSRNLVGGSSDVGIGKPGHERMSNSTGRGGWTGGVSD